MNNKISDKMKALTQSYAAALPKKVNDIELIWQEIKESNNSDDVSALIREAHTLYGTAGTYGYKLISDAASQLEKECKSIQLKTISLSLQETIEKLIFDMKQLALNPPEENIASKLDLDDVDKMRVIYILSDDKSQYEQIENYNYKVSYYNQLSDFLSAIDTSSPDMVIVDVNYVEGITSEHVRKIRDNLIILMYTSDKDDLQTRLLAIRHGGQAFVLRPFEINVLLLTLDDLFEAKAMSNEKILIVDDSKYLVDCYALVLESAGFICKTMTDPTNFLSVLQEFQPDLILMDVNMPHCSGSELAQIVNQQENLNAIPIIFLSSISERSKQLELLSIAGDDFLTKPVKTKHLVVTIRNRLMRSRMIRSRMMRDSLTNLYNHTMILHQLEREIAIAARYHQAVQVVLLDIDNFKLVNDKYGHQVGDQILKELSVFLQTHLRKSDLIGRYGGEEFLIILPNINSESAFDIIDNLRQRFSYQVHKVGKEELFVTFSAGIASYPSIDTISQLIKVADQALYQAKEKGRNRIEVAITQ